MFVHFLVRTWMYMMDIFRVEKNHEVYHCQRKVQDFMQQRLNIRMYWPSHGYEASPNRQRVATCLLCKPFGRWESKTGSARSCTTAIQRDTRILVVDSWDDISHGPRYVCVIGRFFDESFFGEVRCNIWQNSGLPPSPSVGREWLIEPY